jgi:hypothetical protein
VGRARHDDAEYQGSWYSRYRADLSSVCWWLVAQLYRRSEWLVVLRFGLGRGRKARSSR